MTTSNNRRTGFLIVCASFFLLVGFAMRAGQVRSSEKEATIQLGNRLELMLDDYLISSVNKLEFVLHSPRPAEQVMTFEAPWEGPYCDYFTVFQDGDRYRMYYASHPNADFNGDRQYTCYAESRDGIRWTKPALGLISFNGSRANNIVWQGPASHNFAPFLDTNPIAKPQERYRAVEGKKRIGGLQTFVSHDGILWRRVSEEPVITVAPPFDGLFDSQNVAFWDSERREYVCYYRRKIGIDRRRHVARATSPDFQNWKALGLIDLGDSPPEELYTNATVAYYRAPHLLLAFPMRYTREQRAEVPVPEEGKPEACDGVFMFSRDGQKFSRRYMQAFVTPGPDLKNWTKHSNMMAWGLLPTSAEEISVYYTQHYYFPTASLRQAVLRTDGFTSLRAGYQGGEFTTLPLIFAGSELVLNFAASAVGNLRVEILDKKGTPLPGFRLEDCQLLRGDYIESTVVWTGRPAVGKLAGQPVRLRFVMRDCDLYSLRFR